MLRFLLFIPLAFLSFICFAADKNRLLLATTTSTDNSGLLEKINPLFEDRYGVELNVVAVGSGKAIRLARNGDVDLILRGSGAVFPEAKVFLTNPEPKTETPFRSASKDSESSKNSGKSS